MAKNSVYLLVLTVLMMLSLGIVMLFSTSAYADDAFSGDIYYYVKRQGVWLGLGLVCCVICAVVDYDIWRKMVWPLFGLSIVLLALCFVPPIGQKINGSWRWINIGFANFQPSELAKFASVAFLAMWYARYEKEASSLFKGFFIPSVVVGSMMALILMETDLGATALIGGTMFLLMFVAGTNLFVIGTIAASGLGGLFYLAHNMAGRSERLFAHLNLEATKDGAGLQQLMGLVALGSGGVDGLGLGNGRQKMMYLPFAHTDFIFPMIGEELGLKFTLAVVSAFLVILACGILISLHARDRFGMLLGFGLMMLLGLQAIVNIGVTTALLPNKGLGLPFISYGGSNLLLCLAIVGILINIHRNGVFERDTRSIALRKLSAKVRRRS